MTTIDHDLPCIRCNYNLRTLPITGRCPECGLAVAKSLTSSRWHETLLRWFPRGCWAAAIALLIMHVLYPLYDNLPTQLERHGISSRILYQLDISLWIFIAAGILGVAAWWMLVWAWLDAPRNRIPRWLPLTTLLVQAVCWATLAAHAILSHFRGQLAPTNFGRVEYMADYAWKLSTLAGPLADAAALLFLWIALRAVGNRILPWLFLPLLALRNLWNLMDIIDWTMTSYPGAPAIWSFLGNSHYYGEMILATLLALLWIIVALKFRRWARHLAATNP